jgi:predicted AAA+ superfamily ATPase
MYSRILNPPENQSFFLFGARGTGKSTWLKHHYPQANLIDLLEDEIFIKLQAHPQSLMDLIDLKKSNTVVIDEIQRIPQLLNEVHRLIEKEKIIFILTGSSARKLKGTHANLLGGRAQRYEMFPLVAAEAGEDFKIQDALKYGMLPARFSAVDERKYLTGYLALYVREEVQQERLTRNISAFHRFLEAASFSQGQPLVITKVAEDCHVERKTVEEYFNILEDLLLAFRVPVFAKRSKRDLLNKEKFFFFDCGLFQAIRPRGPLDSDAEIGGAALETLVFQEVRAVNALKNLGYQLHHWRTKSKHEVDLVLYGERGLHAFEIKSTAQIRSEDTEGLNLFLEDYPMATATVLYGGSKTQKQGKVTYLPVTDFLTRMEDYL